MQPRRAQVSLSLGGQISGTAERVTSPRRGTLLGSRLRRTELARAAAPRALPLRGCRARLLSPQDSKRQLRFGDSSPAQLQPHVTALWQHLQARRGAFLVLP